MIRRSPRSTHTDTLVPYTTLFRSEAIRYALTRWDGLSRFIDDGRIDLDSNTVERSIRPLARNRKNALFAGSDEGGDNWAVIATLRSEEHTSDLQSLMRISYAVFCLKKKKQIT